MMTSSNLAICVGPSVLWSNENPTTLDANYSKNVSAVMQILIDEYEQIYGDKVPRYFDEDDKESAVTKETSVDEANKNKVSGQALASPVTFIKGPNAGKSAGGNFGGMVQRSGKSKLMG